MRILKQGSCEENFWKVAEVQSPKDKEVREPNLSIQPELSFVLGLGGGNSSTRQLREPDLSPAVARDLL